MSLIRRRTPVVVDGDGSRRRGPGRLTRPDVPSPALRHRALRRFVQGALVVAAGTAALSLAGPFALRPFTDVAGAAGDVTVAFVLDFGGTPAQLVVGCVSVPDSDTRYDALTAFTQSRGLQAPTYAPSGLLCSINGTPATGCGQVVAGGRYIYWSYFTGGQGGWTYASTGAFGTVTTNDVEGWRFQDPGTGKPNDPAPRSTARYAAICATTPSPTTTTPGVRPATREGAAAGGGSGGGAHRQRTARSAAGATSTTTSTSTTTTSSTYPAVTSTTLPDTSVPPDPEVGIASVAHHVTPGSGPDPIIVGGIIVAGLAIAAWFRWRKRPRTP